MFRILARTFLALYACQFLSSTTYAMPDSCNMKYSVLTPYISLKRSDKPTIEFSDFKFEVGGKGDEFKFVDPFSQKNIVARCMFGMVKCLRNEKESVKMGIVNLSYKVHDVVGHHFITSDVNIDSSDFKSDSLKDCLVKYWSGVIFPGPEAGTVGFVKVPIMITKTQ